MNAGFKWIAGLVLAVAAVAGGAIAYGQSEGGEQGVEAVLSEGSAAVDDAIEFVANEVVQETPAYDPDDPFVIKRILPIEGPIRYGEWHWDDEGVPDGPLVMTVDLQARVISVFRNGYEIGAAAALLGTPEHPTPVGTFPILTKERHNVSEKYGNAPMPWTLRLTWDGVAVHGGSTVELGYASHGCISVPDEFASRLFDIAEVGDVVIITDGVMTGVGGSLATDS
ncbi:L,D-transpeptidase family protein [Aurantiacibacter sp. MUD11]|uniref:L,D-transpeptidase family protein n=1 Tax=Aurantiacibacter sp. MUD11 TaxID=3003265 RepID=UPI0022AA01AC|nr:L,D-transpeptidase family protein [Aurantiacibacter sp. MUD11]WAT19194.1 L,D-transpeptidase family protein [Aurantiacibacter sp. MUD11]